MSSLSSILERLRAARTNLLLRDADRVGRSPKLIGQPNIVNGGRLEIGDDFSFSARPAPSHLIAAAGGRIMIGDRVRISYGAAISARLEVKLGDDVAIGPYAVIMDSDYHVVGDRSAIDAPLAVSIEAGAKLGARVTVLRGSVIGAGAVVQGGSVVSGRVAAGSVVGGVPARALRASPEVGAIDEEASEVPKLIMSVLGLSTPPGPDDGPLQIREWDSLGSLKIVLAVEEAYGLALSEQEIKSTQTVGELVRVVAASRAQLAVA